MVNRKSKEGAGGGRVWRFVDYEGRFAPTSMPHNVEMPQYVKWYINAWTGAGGEWLVAVNRLRAERDFIWYQGAIVELLTVAMNQQVGYQGYLVTGSKVPMTASDVGKVLRVEYRRTRTFLARCEAVGILERVAWPSPGSGEDIPDDDSLRLLTDVPRTLVTSGGRGRGKGGRKRGFRAENKGPPLNKSEKVESSATQSKEIEGTAGGRDAAPSEAAQVVCPACGHTGKVAQGAKAMQCSQCKSISPVAASAPPRPPTPSTSPDAGVGPGGSRRPGPTAGPRSDTHIVRIGDVLAGQAHRYSAEANAFGEQVRGALGYGVDDRNDVAHYAKLWQKARGELTEAACDKVKAKALRIAGQIASGQRRPDDPCAYVERTIQNEIRDQKRAHRVRSG